MVAGLPPGVTQSQLFLLQLAQDPTGRGQRLLNLAFPGANDPLANITRNPLITGSQVTSVQDKQIFNAQLAQFDSQYGSLFQLGASMSPVAQQLGQQATLGILQEQLTGRTVTAGGGLGALGVLNGFGGGGGIPGLGGGIPAIGGGIPGLGGGIPAIGGGIPGLTGGGIGSIGQLGAVGVNLGAGNGIAGNPLAAFGGGGVNPLLLGAGGGLPGGFPGGIPGGAQGGITAVLGQLMNMLVGMLNMLGGAPR